MTPPSPTPALPARADGAAPSATARPGAASRRAVVAVLAALLLGAATVAVSAAPRLDQGSTSAVLVDRAGLALQGLDPVLLVEEGRATPGMARHAWIHDGAPYRFVSAETMARFRAAPHAYLPAYGGFSALHVAAGRKEAGDPRHATRLDGRLFLHRDAESRRAFEAEAAALVARADAGWPMIRYRTPRMLEAAAAR